MPIVHSQVPLAGHVEALLQHTSVKPLLSSHDVELGLALVVQLQPSEF